MSVKPNGKNLNLASSELSVVKMAKAAPMAVSQKTINGESSAEECASVEINSVQVEACHKIM